MALDLRTQFPRSPFDDSLGGYPWLGRLIDKARAHAAGTGGDYTTYPCAGDQRFLAHFGLDADAVGQLIKGGASDDEILAYVREHAKGGPEAIAAYRQAITTPYSSLLMRLACWAMRKKSAADILRHSPGVPLAKLVTFPLIVAAEEGYPLPV